VCIALCCCRIVCSRGEVVAPAQHHLLVQNEDSPRLGGSAAATLSSKLPLEAEVTGGPSSAASSVGPGAQASDGCQLTPPEEDAAVQVSSSPPELAEVESGAYRMAAADEEAYHAVEAEAGHQAADAVEAEDGHPDPDTEGEAANPKSSDELESLAYHAGASSSGVP